MPSQPYWLYHSQDILSIFCVLRRIMNMINFSEQTCKTDVEIDWKATRSVMDN